MNAETFNLEQALADILDASPGPAREFVYGYHWKRLAASEGHMKRLPQYKPPYRCPHVENVQRLLNDGLTRVDVSKELGISTTTVSGIVARNNLQWPRKKPARERIDADHLRELLARDMTWDAIAAELGEPVSTVRRRARDLGMRRA